MAKLEQHAAWDRRAQTRRPQTADPRKIIQRLDRKINAVRREMLRREKIDQQSWRSWGEAWERQPELCRRDRNLFWLRGEFQIQRGAIEAREADRAARTRRLSKAKLCKTCGGSGFAKAA